LGRRDLSNTGLRPSSGIGGLLRGRSLGAADRTDLRTSDQWPAGFPQAGRDHSQPEPKSILCPGSGGAGLTAEKALDSRVRNRTLKRSSPTTSNYDEVAPIAAVVASTPRGPRCRNPGAAGRPKWPATFGLMSSLARSREQAMSRKSVRRCDPFGVGQISLT